MNRLKSRLNGYPVFFVVLCYQVKPEFGLLMKLFAFFCLLPADGGATNIWSCAAESDDGCVSTGKPFCEHVAIFFCC